VLDARCVRLVRSGHTRPLVTAALLEGSASNLRVTSYTHTHFPPPSGQWRSHTSLTHPTHQRLLAAGSAASRRKRKDAHREYGAPRQAITPQRARRSPNSPTANLAEKEVRTPYHPCLLPSDARPKRRTGASQHGCAEMAAAVMPRAAASSRAATTSPASASHRHHAHAYAFPRSVPVASGARAECLDALCHGGGGAGDRI